jgi:hypothetical protein
MPGLASTRRGAGCVRSARTAAGVRNPPDPLTPMLLLARVVDLLSSGRIPHALIGAAALAVRGIARSTLDIDLLTTDTRVLQDSWWAALDNATVDVRRGEADDPLAGVVRIEAPAERPVDVIVGRHAWQARAVARADRTAGIPPVVTALDLILLKLYAGGTQDLWDVRELLRQPDADDLPALVEAELAALPQSMRDAWRDVRQ